jgi:hypothetical protein
MKFKAFIRAGSGRGYMLELYGAAPAGFPGDFRVCLEEINYYSEAESDDIVVQVLAQDLATEIHTRPGTNQFEVTFEGTLEFEIDDTRLPEFQKRNDQRGVDYYMELATEDGGQTLASGDDWEFIENYNLVLELQE